MIENGDAPKIIENINVKGDGNCFFRCISLKVHGTEENYSKVRQQIVEFLEKNEEDYSELVLDKKGKTYKEYLQEMQKDKVWATEVEILAAGPVYKCEIFVQVCKQGTDKWEWHCYSKGDKGKCDHTKD